jgi:hypothetical protein
MLLRETFAGAAIVVPHPQHAEQRQSEHHQRNRIPAHQRDGERELDLGHGLAIGIGVPDNGLDSGKINGLRGGFLSRPGRLQSETVQLQRLVGGAPAETTRG